MGDTLNGLTGLAPRLNENRTAKNLMEVFPRTIQFNLQGEEGPFFLTISGGQMAVAKGVSDKAELVVAGDTREFAKVVQGGLDVTHPIARGHITIERGKVSEMTLLNRILWAANRR
jgi:putative sterol carrier protein